MFFPQALRQFPDFIHIVHLGTANKGRDRTSEVMLLDTMCKMKWIGHIGYAAPT